MGDPRKTRKKYETPMHPWIAGRIEDEKALTFKYGTKNKKEVWRMGTALKRFKDQAKHLSSLTGNQAELEREQMMNKIVGLGLVSPGAGLDDILSLTLDDFMSRRLQTVMVKRLLARTTKQARQLITHGHVMVGKKVITSPSFLVKLADETNITFRASSPLNNEQHPERFSEAELLAKEERDKAKAAKQKGGEEEIEPPAYSAEDIEDPEELGKKKKKAEEKVEEVKPEIKDEKKSDDKKEDKAEEKKPEAQKEEKVDDKVEEKPAAEKKADEKVEAKKAASDSDKQDEQKKEDSTVEEKADKAADKAEKPEEAK